MKKLLLILTFFVISTGLRAECIKTPGCISEGYTKTPEECPGGYLKCPYGDTVFCED